MSIDRQFGVHEIPGTETEAPNKRREVSANFEGQMRDYVGSIWLKIGELERKVVNLEEWREEMEYRRNSPGRLATSGPGEGAKGADGLPSPATGEAGRPPPKPSEKPWAAEGVSKATWYRRHKGGA